jgi:hypothetical protein
LHFSCACLDQVEAKSGIESKHFVHPPNQDESRIELKHFDESGIESKHFVHPSNQDESWKKMGSIVPILLKPITWTPILENPTPYMAQVTTFKYLRTQAPTRVTMDYHQDHQNSSLIKLSIQTFDFMECSSSHDLEL